MEIYEIVLVYVSGTETTIEYCHPRGSRTDDGYIHMCSVCAYTTKLPKDRFPRYVNEIGCDSNDCNCFTINDICKCFGISFILW